MFMYLDDPAQATWRHDLILDELAAIGMAVVRDLRQRIAATDDAQETLKLISGLNQTARSVRQCLALQAKLFREVRGFDRARIDERRALQAARAEAAKDQVRAQVRQALWNEYERWDYNQQACRLDVELLRLDCDAGPVEDVVARLCKKLGVTPPPAPDAQPPACATLGRTEVEHVGEPPAPPAGEPAIASSA